MTTPLGITLSLDGVQKFEADGRRAAGTVDNIGVSAKQTAAALRGVPAQFTDIITSLQGGQAPLTVFLQQGGQLKDMFGGAGAAAKALGGYVVGLINPFTVAAAAGVALAVAYKQGSAEADAYTKSIALTGNAAGVTAAQLQGMASRVSDVVGTQAKAADVLAQLVGTGNVAKAALEQQAATAIRLERNVGIAVKDTVKEFAELGKEPVEAAKKLNERYNYLTAAVYEQIKSLKEQGKTQEAVAVSQAAYERAMSNVADTVQARLGTLERGWLAISDAAKKGWDAMLGIGRQATAAQQLDADAARIKQLREQLKGDDGAGFSETGGGAAVGVGANVGRARRRAELEMLEQRQAMLQESIRLDKRGAEAQAARAEAEKAAIAASDELQKVQGKGLTQQQQMNKALEDYRRQLDALRAVNPSSASLSREAIARGERAIRDQFKPTGSGAASGGENEVAALRAQANEAERYLEQLRARGAEVEKLTAGEQRAAKIREELKTSITGTARAQKELALVEADRLATAERATVTEKARIKSIEESEAAYRKFLDSIVKTGDAYGTQADQQEAANASFGRSKTAIEEAALAQQKLYLANEKAAGPWDPARIKAMDYAIQQQERYVAALVAGDGKALNARADELLRSAQELSSLYADESQLVGLSNLERAKTVALRQVELKYAKELEVIEKSTATTEEALRAKQAARDTVERAKRIEGEAVVAKAIRDDWTRTTDEINRSLTDALLRGFESGKGFAQNLRDTVKNMFSTLVLRPVISAVMNPVASLVGGVVNSGMSALGLVSNVASGAGLLSSITSGAGLIGRVGGLLGLGTTSATAGLITGAGSTGLGLTAGGGLGLSTGGSGLGLSLGSGTAGAAGAAGSAGAGGIGALLSNPITLGLGAVAVLSLLSKLGKGETRTGGQFGVSFDGTVTNNRRDQVYTYQGQQYDRDFSGGRRDALVAGQAYRLEGDKVDNEQAIRDAVAGTAGSINEFLRLLGSSATLTRFSAGFETSTKGRGGNFAGGMLSNGVAFGESGKGDNYAGTLYEKFSTNSPDFKQALADFTLDLKQSTIQALQSVTDIPQTVQRMLKGVDAEALSDEAANALLESINAQIVGVTDLRNAFDAMGLDKLAKMGFDAAAGLAAAAGGFDKLKGNLNSFYDNYYTDDEKRANLQKQLDKQFASLGIAVPKSRDEYRKLVENALGEAEVQDQTRQALAKDVGKFFSTVGKDGLSLAELGRSSLADKIPAALLGNTPSADPAAMDKLNGFLAGVAELSNKGLDSEAFNSSLADLITLNGEVLGLGKDASQTAAVLLGLNGVFAELNETAAETAARVAKEQADAREKGYRSLERAVAAERDLIKARLDVAREAERTTSALFDTLRAARRDLLDEVDSTRGMQAEQGRAFITQSLQAARTSGYLPESGAIAEAVAAARNGLDPARYASSAEADFQRLVVAGQLQGLENITGKQLSSAERTIVELETQNGKLDKTLSNMREQIDILNGTYEATVSVDEAVRNLTGLMFPERGVNKPDKISGGGSGSGGAVWGGSSGSSSSGSATSGSTISSTGLRTYADGSTYQLTEGELDLYRRGLLGRVPGFANGGLHTGGLRMVGERGWEIEATGPARYWNQEQLGRALGGSDTSRLESLVAALTAEVVDVKAELELIRDNTREHKDQFENWSGGGQGAGNVRVVNQVSLAA